MVPSSLQLILTFRVQVQFTIQSEQQHCQLDPVVCNTLTHGKCS